MLALINVGTIYINVGIYIYIFGGLYRQQNCLASPHASGRHGRPRHERPGQPSQDSQRGGGPKGTFSILNMSI